MLLKFDDQQIRDIFGSEDAQSETPERFREYFVKNRAYENLRSQLPLRIVVGHKGVGKTALLRYSYDEDHKNGILSVFLKPDDLTELLKIERGADINSLIDAWKSGIKRHVAEKAIENLTEGHVDTFDESIITIGARKITAIVRDALKSLKPEYIDASNTIFYNNFMSSGKINIYIDDIDRGWQARPQDVLNISAMINALKDIAGKDSNIQCRIAIRTDVYYLVRTSDESTDKIEQDIIRLIWTNDEILKLMAFRISTYFHTKFDREKINQLTQADISHHILSLVMDEKFQGRGKWENERVHRILMSLCRSRPRDLVKLLHGAARRAAQRGGDKINSQDFIDSFPSYSEERLQDLFNEFRSEVADIDKFIMQFRPTKLKMSLSDSFNYKNDQIIVKIKEARRAVNVAFASGRPVTDKAILTFLYKVDFIIAKFTDGEKTNWKFFDQGRFLAHEYVDFGNSWEVHPAYRWALQPNNMQSVIDSIAVDER